MFILQEHLYEIPEYIVNEVKGLFCLASWWWWWGFTPAVRDGDNVGANWFYGFDKTPVLINQRNIYKGYNFIAVQHLLVMVGFKVLE